MRPRHFTRSNLFRTLVVIALSVAFAIWNPGMNSFFRGVFHTVLLPVERVFSSVAYGVRDLGEFLSSIGELNEENERLLEENVRLRAENAELLYLRSENEELRRMAELGLRDQYDLVSGMAVARGEEHGVVLLDRGSMHGIRSGAPVLSSVGAFIGVVDEVYPASARIRLVASSESAIGGITAENGTKGVIRGDRGLGVVFSMTLRSEPLSVGDRVMTSGSGEGIPPGLFVGTVASIQETGDRLFREATLTLPDIAERLRFLFVIREAENL
jgi:rod shape-determining protein MreC